MIGPQRNAPSRPSAFLWAIGGAVLGLLLLAAALVLGRIRGAALSAQLPAQPALTVIPLPSATPIITSAPTQSTASPTPSLAPPGQGPDLIPGALVEVAGTEGEGLRLRESPGLDSRIKFLGLDSEVFQVQDGPVQIDGFTWWLLANPYDQTKFGWAVDLYLRKLDS